MRASLFTGCLTAAFAAAVLTFPRAASAADLYGDGYAAQTYDDAYDTGDDGYDMGARRPGSIKDGYPVPVPPPEAGAPPPRYAERPPVRVERYTERYDVCLERWEVRSELRRQGWSDVRPMGGDGSIVHIRARRYDSRRPFDLRVDRCSGEVLAARPAHRGVAYRDWRWVK